MDQFLYDRDLERYERVKKVKVNGTTLKVNEQRQYKNVKNLVKNCYYKNLMMMAEQVTYWRACGSC